MCVTLIFVRILYVSADLCPKGERRLLVNCVPMREQRTAKPTLNSVFDILKLISIFTLSSQKVAH